MVQDAVRCHFEDDERPRMIRLHVVKDKVIPACSRLATWIVLRGHACCLRPTMEYC